MNDKERESSVLNGTILFHISLYHASFSIDLLLFFYFFYPRTKTKWSKNISLLKGEKNAFGRAGDGR